MSHPTFTALVNAKAAALRNLNAECETGTAPASVVERLHREHDAALSALLLCCPTCGGRRTRTQGRNGHQCWDCTARDEQAHTGPF